MMLDKQEFIAWVRHIAWCSFMTAAGQMFNEQPTDDQWKSLMQGVQWRMDNPGATSRDNHKNWLLMKKSQGWKYGKIKDEKAKTHPDMVPYSELPYIERLKDQMDIMAHRMGEELFCKLQQPDKEGDLDGTKKESEEGRNQG